MDTADHEHRIGHVLTALWPAFRGTEPEWTRATFEALREIGDSLGFRSRYSQKCGGPGEWLWDFCWLECDEGGRILAMPLVVESEWGRGWQHDFEKLLVANAPLRVMVVQAAADSRLEQIVTQSRELSQSFLGSQARYMVVGWVYGGGAPHVVVRSWDAGRAL